MLQEIALEEFGHFGMVSNFTEIHTKNDNNSHAIVFFGKKQLFGNKKMPRLEIIASVSDLQERFDQDRRNTMESLDYLDD